MVAARSEAAIPEPRTAGDPKSAPEFAAAWKGQGSEFLGDPEIDSGDIAFQREIAYGWEDTGKTLYEKASKSIVELFRECYPRIVAFDIPRRRQDPSEGSFHRRSELEDRSLMALDCKNTIRDILNLLRARTFEPHPACRFVEGESTYEVRLTIQKMGD
jgi:methionyl-tRNA formyltransferase